MRSKIWWRGGLLVALGLPTAFLALRVAQNATGKSPASLVSPKRDETVGRSHEVTGKLAIAGHPLVLVRPDAVGGEWYVQPPVELSDRGYFKSKVRFGNDKTAAGAKFHVAVVVLRTPEEAEFFKGKEALPMVPPMFACSEPIPVVLGKPEAEPADKNPSVGTLLRPAQDAKVKMITEVAGKLTTKGWPVVVVRSDDPNESWWVQGTAQLGDDGDFICQAQFGNDKTPTGSKFRVAFITLPSSDEADALTVGLALKKLPDVPRSEEVVVTLDRPEAKAEKE